MTRFRSRLIQIFVLTLLVLLDGSVRTQGGGTLNGHSVRLDAGGKLLAWVPDQNRAYSQVLGLNTSFLLNSMPTAANGMKLYYSYSYSFYPSLEPDVTWPHNPAGTYAMFTDSGLAYAAYSGDPAMMNLVRDVLTFHLDHGMTPATWHWANVPFASSDGGVLTYEGAHFGDVNGRGDGFGVIEPDKVGELGLAFLKYHQYSSVPRFRDAAIQAADALASHVVPGDATTSPWPFRVFGQTNVVREAYTAHVIKPIALFDELIRLNLGNVAAYQAARQTAWAWLMAFPMQNNVWANYFEDIPLIPDTSNLNQLVAVETARYLLQHPEMDPAWEAHVRGILAWTEATFGAPEFGALSIQEQQRFAFPMGSHTSRYASVNAMLAEATGDAAAREKAFRSFNWATYMCRPDGVTIDGPLVNHVWWTDGYGDYIRHFLAGMAAVPEWSPAGESHLLRSTSVVRGATYSAGQVAYDTFDPAAREVLRLNFTPQSVTADGVVIPLRGDLQQQGWTYDAASGVLRVRHDAGTRIVVSNTVQGPNAPPAAAIGSPANGSTFAAPANIAVSVTANDTDGTIALVEVFDGGAPIASMSTPSAPGGLYTFTWTGVGSGVHQLTARATDNLGARTTSAAVQVTVTAPANQVVVPNVVNATQAAASSALAAAGLSVGPPTSAPSATVPAGSVVSQSPAAGVLVSTGTAVSLTISSGPPVVNVTVDKVVFADGTGTRTTAPFSTAVPGELLIAFVSSDGKNAIPQTATVTGAGLTWTLVRRTNTQNGTSEIWKATAAGVLTNVTVTSAQGTGNTDQSLTVVAFAGAGGTGATAGASAASGAPTVTLTTTAARSLVYAVGNDWDRAIVRTLPSTQAMVHQYLAPQGDTAWVQNRVGAIATAGTAVQMNATAPTTDRWNLTAVEIVPSSGGVAVPAVVNLTQAAATSAITSAGLALGAVTTTSSTTVPSGSVISQNPAAGTVVAPGTAVSLVVSSGAPAPPPPPPPSGPVAALAFDENAGSVVSDTSGRGNNGTTSGTTWTTGRYGSGLRFNGTSALVTIPGSSSLNFTTGMTLEAWVRPTTTGGWRSILLKERTGGLAYALYSSNSPTSAPAGYINVVSDRAAAGTAALPLNTWSHLAVTYDGANLRLYVNAALVRTTPQTGSITVSSGALRIGGNQVYGEFFNGIIDEVRLYDRALTAAQIQTDLNTRIKP